MTGSPRNRGLDGDTLLAIARLVRSFPALPDLAAPPSLSELIRLFHAFPGLGTRDLALRHFALAHQATPADEAADLLRPLADPFGLSAAEVAAAASFAGMNAAAGLVAAHCIDDWSRHGRPDNAEHAQLEHLARAGLSRFFFLLFLAWALHQPHELRECLEQPRELLDRFVVFGLSQMRLWHLLGNADQYALLVSREGGRALFLDAVLRFRPDLAEVSRKHGDGALAHWLQHHGRAEYDIRTDPPALAPRRPLLTLVGPTRYILGLSDDCESILRALLSAGVLVELRDMPPAPWIGVDADKDRLVRGLVVPHATGERALISHTLFEATGWALRHWQEFRAFARVDLFSPWELPRLPPGWDLALRLFDTALVPTRFVQESYAAAEVEEGRVHHLLPSVERHGRSQGPQARALRRSLGVPPGRRLVVAVFDFSSYLARKNPAAAIATFARLRRQVAATLVIKTTRARRFPADAAKLRRCLRGLPDVVWIDAEWSNQRMEALLSAADAYVSLHRSEGFGRNIGKALVLGTPVVVTDFSGNRDLAEVRGYHGVAWRTRQVGPRDYVGGAGQWWAEPDRRAAVRQLLAALRPRARDDSRAAVALLGRARFSRDLLHILGRAEQPVGEAPA